MTEVVLRRLGHGEEERARRFLFAHPERDLYLCGLLLRLGAVLPPGCGVLYAAFEQGRIAGIFLHSPTILLASHSRDSIDAFAALVADLLDEQPITELLGPATMVRAFYDAFRALRPERPRLRLYRDDLPLMELRTVDLKARPVLSRDGTLVHPAPLRRAVDRDLGPLVDASRAMTIEELGIDPAGGDLPGFSKNVERKIRAGREFVWTQAGDLVFRAAVSTSTPEAALVEGVFTPGPHRRRGVATQGMLALAHRLLQSHSAVVLFVSSANQPATRLYERMGFRTIGTYQAVYFDAPEPPAALAGPAGSPRSSA